MAAQPPAAAPVNYDQFVRKLAFPRPLSFLLCTALLASVFFVAVRIRLFAVITYGRIIHEFDPWFNYRATEYMVEHGYAKFEAWYDDKVWYPLGRHVGSTTYPGLQLTAYALHELLKHVHPMSVNDVCVLMPAAFGGVASLLCGALAYEVTFSRAAAICAAAFMAVIPAHLMRSVAGGFDNESIAVTALCATFYLWARALRSDAAWPSALLCGVAYAYMVAAWGGYLFVLNMIGAHALALVLLGRFSRKLWRAYSLWFVIGTAGAMLGPARYLVGWQPLQSMEQLGPLLVFLLLQGLQLAAALARALALDTERAAVLRVQVLGAGALLAALAAAVLLPSDFLGPLSARVRSLFIRHTKTGNPLVDSVAEHQATPTVVYWQYFHLCALLGPVGWGLLLAPPRTDAAWFMLVCGAVSLYFSGKMIRLVLLLSPAAAVCAGVALGWILDQTAEAMLTDAEASAAAAARERAARAPPPATRPRDGAPAVAQRELYEEVEEDLVLEIQSAWRENVHTRRWGGCAAVLLLTALLGLRFVPHAWRVGQQLSEPQLLFRGVDLSAGGEIVQVDDLMEAYWWLRDNTPEDSRVMAWWDYGYQISGVANRTTLADGNTWNHEHIALLGKCLVSSEAASHAITRHLADYVLVWTTRYAGMSADDLAKSAHMARIAGSVYADIDPKAFHFEAGGAPSAMMRESLLWRLHHHRYDPREPPLRFFEEAYTTARRMVRIFKVLQVDEASKAWRASKGIECSKEECYPEALRPVLEQKNNFKQ